MKRFFSRVTPSILFALLSLELINFLDTSGKVGDNLNLNSDNNSIKPNDNSSATISSSVSTTNPAPKIEEASSSAQNSLPVSPNISINEGTKVSDSINTQNPNSKSTSAKNSSTTGEGSKSNTKTSSSTINTSNSTISSILTIKGDPIEYRYGTLQVEIKVENKKIIDIVKLEAPSGPNAKFTNYAFPILIAQALNGQTAYIDGASGATYTSQAFVDSLQSAINRIP